jgi:hypothetical protein
MESGERILEPEQTRKRLSARLSTVIDEIAEEIAASQEARYLAVCEERDRLLQVIERQEHQIGAALSTESAAAIEQQGSQQSPSGAEASALEGAVSEEPILSSSAIAPEIDESAPTTVRPSLTTEVPQAVTEEAIGGGEEEIGDSYYIRKAAGLKLRNQELEAEVSRLQGEVGRKEQERSEVTRLQEQLAKYEVLATERDVVQQKLVRSQRELAGLEEELKQVLSDRGALEKDLKRAQDEVRGCNRQIMKLQERQRLAEEVQNRSAADVAQVRDELGSARAELDQVNQNLSICQSAREVLRLENGKLKQDSRQARDEYNWEVARRLSPVLGSLSALAGLEPNETQGLSPRSVFEDFKKWVEQVAGGRLEPFPAKSELSGDLLWLDADTTNLELLMERYDWAGERPFEGLPTGQRKRAFRLSRRGWAVSTRVVARAFVTVAPDQEARADEVGAASEQA